VHAHLVQRARDLLHVQADEIRVKAQGKVLWLATAIMVSTRLWLGAVVSQKRDEGLIGELVTLIKSSALARPLLICVDGLRRYLSAIQEAFPVHSPMEERSSQVGLLAGHSHRTGDQALPGQAGGRRRS
jgi:transposase-like protein